MQWGDGKTCTIVGVVGNLALTIVKFIAGLLAHSTAMIADAVHSFSDIVASSVVFVSLRIAERPADKDHHYGHGNAETIAAVIVSGILFATGTFIGIRAFETIIHHTYQVPGMMALWAALLSIVVKEGMFRYTRWVGKQLNSPAILANAQEHRSDALSSIAALVGILGARLKWPFLDPAAAIFIGFFIIHMAYDILKENLNILMDAAPDRGIELEIVKRLFMDSRVKNVHDVKVHQIGSYYSIALDIDVDKNISVAEGHQIANDVKELILGKVEGVREVTVHVDPFLGEQTAEKDEKAILRPPDEG